MLFALAAALIGFAVGVVLSFLAFEELEHIRKKLHLAKRALMLTFFITTTVLLLMYGLYTFFVGFFAFSLLVLYFELIEKYELTKLDLAYYVFLFTGYTLVHFKIPTQGYASLLAGLIFFYGVPVGSVAHLSYLEFQTRKDKK